MKKSIILLLSAAAIVALSASCSKGYDIESEYGVGGRSSANSGAGRSYMMQIADNIVTDCLDELEHALLVNSRGKESLHFDTGSASIESVGAVWTVIAPENKLQGLTIKRTSVSETWEMHFDGEYLFDINNDNYYDEGYDSSYPTEWTITAKRVTGSSNRHFSWNVSINGTRTEQKGYSCSFTTPSYIEYIASTASDKWIQLYGVLYMTTYKDGSPIDLSMLEFRGSLDKAEYARGL